MTEPQPHTTPAPAPAAPRRRTKKASRTPPLDWAASHGPVSGAVSATTGAAAVALLGTATGMPHEIPLLVGAAGAIGHGIGHSVFRRLTARTGIARCTSWLLAGGWTTWALAEGPLTWKCLGVLAGAGVSMGALASNAAAHEEAAEQDRLSAEAKAAIDVMDTRRRTIAREWTDRIKRLTGLDVIVNAVEFWPNGAGYSVGGDLPGGALWTQLRDRSKQMAADARLPHGCLVEAEAGPVQGSFAIDISTVNIMADLVPYPDDFSALSILTGIPWGLRPNSSEILVFLREACALILGPPGSGKSTFGDGIIAGLARCTDVLTWVIDLKGGAVGIPWARPYLEANGHLPATPGQQPVPEGTKPGVDWIAHTPAEALLMLTVALIINTARQQGYQELLNAKDTTLLPVSAKIPQIEIVVDEGAELLSAPNSEPHMKEVKKLMLRVMRLTRAMGERAILTALDGNLSAIGNTEVRKYSPVGAALTSGENATSNVGKLFSNAKVDTSQLSEKGAGVIGQSGEHGFKPTAFKTWYTSPSMVRACTIATSDLRATLDQISRKAAGRIYTERWSAQRAGWLWNSSEYQEPDVTAYLADLEDLDDDTPQPRPTTTSTGSERASGLNLSYKRKQQPLPTEDEDQLAEQFRQELDAMFPTTTEPGTTGLNLSYKRKNTSDNTDPRHTYVRDLIRQVGNDGIDTQTIWEALRTKYADNWDRTVVTNWLSKDVQAGRLHRKDKGIYAWGPAPTDN